MPRRGMMKINIHGCFFAEALPNGNVSGFGVVIRNSRGKILRMLSGSLGIRNRRVNEYHAMLEGCKRAYVDDWEHYILESDHFDSVWEWHNSGLEGVDPEHAFVVQQLNQRKDDINIEMEVTLCDHNANELAAYLANHGAHNYKVMVTIAQPFGRVFELWSLDMGLGPVNPQFMAVNEADLALEVVDEEMDQENVVGNGMAVGAAALVNGEEHEAGARNNFYRAESGRRKEKKQSRV
ncbi:hypothetical protein ACET3Z_026761 [Daucus carota]